MRLLDRNVLRSITLPFVIGLMLFVLILLAEVAYHISSTIVGGRVPAELIIRYLLLRAPRAVVWSLPFGTLLGVAMAITTLAHHGEITAMRAGGVSFRRICAAPVAVGVLASLCGILLAQYVVPPSMTAAQEVLAEMMMTQAVVREAHNQYFRDEQGRFFYVEDMLPDENLLRRVAIWERDASGAVRSITVADRAELNDRVWTLRDGATVRLDAQGQPVGEIEHFTERTVTLAQALQKYYAEHRSPVELAPHELRELIAVKRATGSATHQLEVYLHFAYSIPAACLVFALISAPLGHRYARHGTYVGVVVAILVVFLYNGVRSWTLAFGLAGAMPPALAGWAPDVIFGVLGAILLTREG